MKIKAGGKIILIGLFVAGVAFGLNKLGYLDPKAMMASSVPDKVELTTANANNDTAAFQHGGTVNTIAIAPASGDYTAKILTIPWNGTLGLQYANGGPVTTPDSLMAKRGVKLKIERQNMYDQMLTEQIKFAKAVAAGEKKPVDGAAFVIIMGDGYPGYIAGAQESLGKLGQQLEVIGLLGYSRGEDKCMLPAEVKTNPQKARGSLIGAVLRDGDWNICVAWAGDNGIPINPDEKTYDPDAMNFVAVDDFTKADDNLIAGYCESRPIVKNGKITGDKQKVCQNGTATWTPGDVKVARKKGGFVSIASTKEYRWQMPTTLIGNKQWMAQNPEFVKNLLAAAFEGGELVRSNDAALMKAAGVAAQVFAEEDAAYWAKYFKGVTEADATGLQVSLGGSTTNGLGDNIYAFGLNGNDAIYKRVYNVFGNINVKYYPDVMKSVVPYDQVVNTTYVAALAAAAKGNVQVDKPTYSASAQTTGTFAKRAVSIEFETGKAAFTPKATEQLNDLLDQLSIGSLTVQINGHTDNVGDPASNQILSKKRADAVKAWINGNAGSTFPEERIKTRGYGDAQPVGDNKTAAGKAANRRVEIVLLTTN